MFSSIVSVYQFACYSKRVTLVPQTNDKGFMEFVSQACDGRLIGRWCPFCKVTLNCSPSSSSIRCLLAEKLVDRLVRFPCARREAGCEVKLVGRAATEDHEKRECKFRQQVQEGHLKIC